MVAVLTTAATTCFYFTVVIMAFMYRLELFPHMPISILYSRNPVATCTLHVCTGGGRPYPCLHQVEQRVRLGQGNVGRNHRCRTMYVVSYTLFNYLLCLAFVYSIGTFPVIRIPAGSSTSS